MAAENENSNDDQSSKYLKINGQIVNNLIPNDALTYNGHRYKFFNDGMTWEEAKTYCENMGGHLLTITDSGEQAFVEHLLANGSKNNYWMGGYKNNNGEWKLITGETWSYDNWAYKQPDNAYNVEDRLMMYCGRAFGTWNDLCGDCSADWEKFFLAKKTSD